MLINLIASAGGSYIFFRNVSANLREKDDYISSAIGGLVAGSIVGVSRRTIPLVVGMGALTAVATGFMTFTGGHLYGDQDPNVDRLAEKDKIRKTRLTKHCTSIHHISTS